MNLSMILGLGARSVVGVAPPAEDLLSSQSIRFPEANLQFAGQFGGLKQSRTNMPQILNAADSHVIFCWELPREKNHQNRIYELFGNQAAQPGQFQMRFFGTNTDTVARGALSWSHRQAGGGGSTLNLTGPIVEVDRFVAKVSRTLSGADIVYVIDAWNCTDGTKIAGTPNVNPAGVNGITTLAQTHWYVGFGALPAFEPNAATVRTAPSGGAIGACEFLGFYNGAVSDADMSAIALGADPLAQLTPANFGYYRRLRGTDATSLAPLAGTGDTTPAATIVGSLRPGGNLRRQDASDYLTLDRLPDGYMFGCRLGEDTQEVPFIGSLAGTPFSATLTVPKTSGGAYREVCHFNSRLWGRVVLTDDTVLVPWTSLAVLPNPATEGLTFAERSRFSVGIKPVWPAQSQISYMFGNGQGGTVSVSLGRKLQTASFGSIAGRFTDNAGFGGAREQIRIFEGNVSWSDGFAALIDEVSDKAGADVQAISLAVPGTSPLEWIKAAGTRSWSADNTTMGVFGRDVSVVAWQWYSNVQSQGNNYGVNVLDAVVENTGPNADVNWIGNGIFRNGFSFVVSGFTRVTVGTAGPFDVDQNAAASGIPQSRATARQWAIDNGYTAGPAIIDMQIDGVGGPHEAGSTYGTVRLGLREAESVLRAIGISNLQDPSIGTPAFAVGKASFTLAVTLPNAGSTLRVDDTATFGGNVQGFEISTDGGTTWSRSSFTATFSGTTVTVTKTSGDWSAVAAGDFRVRYAFGGPLALGTSLESSLLVRGLLYDGSANEGGLGLPILPLAPTVVAEP